MPSDGFAGADICGEAAAGVAAVAIAAGSSLQPPVSTTLPATSGSHAFPALRMALASLPVALPVLPNMPDRFLMISPVGSFQRFFQACQWTIGTAENVSRGGVNGNGFCTRDKRNVLRKNAVMVDVNHRVVITATAGITQAETVPLGASCYSSLSSRRFFCWKLAAIVVVSIARSARMQNETGK